MLIRFAEHLYFYKFSEIYKSLMSEQSVITIDGITKFYRVGTQTVKALKGVHININSNEYVAIMGPSGSGKTTLMNILGCLDTPTGGSYVLNGIDVSKMGDDELAEVRNKEIGFVFQTFNLLPRYTALDNVMLPLIYAGVLREERETKGKAALANVGLSDRMDHRPNEMSGGQRQRVAVARALINKPSIILADEPTGNLDTKTSIDIMNLFEDIYKQGNTIIVVTHEEDIALHARRIVRLRDGLIESDEINQHPTLAKN